MFNSTKFNKNLNNYDLNAVIQKNIAMKLVKTLKQYGNNFNQIFEIGCGSGFLTENIYNNLKYIDFYTNDIVENSRDYVKNYTKNFIYGNAETIDFPENNNLIISSSVFQWLENFNYFIHKIYNSLNKDGMFAFSMFIDGNYSQIKQYLDIALNYKTTEEIKNILNKYFNILYYEENENILHFNSVKKVLNHIRNTGINVISDKRLTKSQLSTYIESNNTNLNYKYNFVIARKK